MEQEEELNSHEVPAGMRCGVYLCAVRRDLRMQVEDGPRWMKMPGVRAVSAVRDHSQIVGISCPGVCRKVRCGVFAVGGRGEFEG